MFLTIERVKHRRIRQMFVSLVCALALLTTPFYVLAEGTLEIEEQTNPVIITEVQTGAATASDEFIELYNTSAESVDITGWHIRYANAGAQPDATILLAEVTANGSNRIILAGHAYFVLHAPSISLPPGVLGQIYTPTLSKNDKTMAVFARDEAQCQMKVQDAVAWESTAGTTLGEGPAVSAAQSGAHILLQRYLDTEGRYIDTNNNAHDFSLAGSTPGADNPALAPPDNGPIAGSPSPLLPFAAPGCTPPGGDPIPNEGLDPLVITELLPNPDAPLSEPNDEFIELYNPNDEAFQLEDYTIEVGVTTKVRYTFSEGSIEPHAYRAFYFSETNARLVNSNGQARLFDPSDDLLVETAVYASAGGNKVWALIDDTWQWSSTATPNAVNIGDEPEPEPPITQPNNGLAAPQFTELLPAPGSGQMEFIELYNPNDVAFDLSSYVLEAGTTTKYRFTFAAGTLLQPKAFGAFYADQTKLTLANKAGQARLIDPASVVIAESSAYSDAKENQAWIFLDGTWQWTTSPTPNAANVLVAPQAPAKKVASASTKKKQSAAPKSSKSKTSKESDKEDPAFLAATKPSDPLHPGVLAGIVAFAVLYGAYEYRNDLKNRVQQWRANRAARQAAGAGIKGG